jgi:hypothetical protein
MIKTVHLLLLVALACMAHPAAAVSDEPPECEQQTDMQLPCPEVYAAHFMQAVEQDSLIVMGRRVDSAVLRPMRVEYVFSMDQGPPVVQVYAVLKLPLELEELPGCEVSGVTAVMAFDGTIVEVQAHIDTF